MAFDWKGASSGAIGGAGAGSAFGPWGTAVGAGIGALGGGFFGGQSAKNESKLQKTQRELIDQLLGSLSGNGPYANLFSASEADYNKSFREPALAQFRNVTAPTIQGQYTGGQYGDVRSDSTGIEDSLARAGVDLDQLLNKGYVNYQNAARDRQSNAIGQILGQSGAPYSPTFADQFSQGGGIGNAFSEIGKNYREDQLGKEREADRDIKRQGIEMQRQGFDSAGGGR